MNKLRRLILAPVVILSMVFFYSCEKEDSSNTISSNDGVQQRLAYTEKGYIEVEVTPIVKINCYFSDWDKEIMTPVSGLFEYYDDDNNWIASIDFGDGTCDEWATKSWDVNMFPEYPSGSKDFSVFDYFGKKDK